MSSPSSQPVGRESVSPPSCSPASDDGFIPSAKLSPAVPVFFPVILYIRFLIRKVLAAAVEVEHCNRI